MSQPYFRYVPDFDYVSRTKSSNSIADYTTVKNLFKRAFLRSDIIENLTYFDKYNIIGDERPDQVAYKVYDDENLDWLILLANNIIDTNLEWPATQSAFDKIMLEKYGSYDNLYSGVHHYISKEVLSSTGVTIFPAGLNIQKNYPSITYYDSGLGQEVTVASNKFTEEVTNYQYEMQIENDKRNIYVLKQRYLNLVFNDLDDIMKYKKGSQQYVSETLKRGDNIRLY
jgi:hypothetical protein